ncbi:uncharacterized protein LOC111635320 isoform X2 [Centruroides sculpturatus]|uniref:uncharacterized protein LOC111635320 isoform X2 n=1 Tax=Centruroides sculpturatus TaxID=218467 RepID=UPI000C6EBEFD|nr:uncharacterized protein LOC111635320 isoform X2 [Centruroides sculpturatus]
MFFDSLNYHPLPEPLEATSDGRAGFVHPKNLDHFKYRGNKKGLLKQDEPANNRFGTSIFKNHINAACKQAIEKLRPFYEISCDRFNSERLVEDLEEYEFNDDIMGRATNIRINEGFSKHEGCIENSNIIGYNVGCADNKRKTLNKAGSFLKAVWKPVKRFKKFYF